MADHLQPLARAVEMLPSIVLSAEEIVCLQHGLTLDKELSPTTPETAALDAAGRLIAIVGPADGGGLRRLRNLPVE